MAKKRKTLELLITVSVPTDMRIAQVRKEVKTLVNEQCNYSADEGDIRIKRIAKGTP